MDVPNGAWLTGNTFILKPSERDPSCAGAIWRKLLSEAGLPDGCFKCCSMVIKKPSMRILDHPDDCGCVSFVGSTAIGKYIYSRGCARMANAFRRFVVLKTI